MSEKTAIRHNFSLLGDNPKESKILKALSRSMSDDGFDHFVKGMTSKLEREEKIRITSMLTAMRADAKAKKLGSV